MHTLQLQNMSASNSTGWCWAVTGEAAFIFICRNILSAPCKDSRRLWTCSRTAGHDPNFPSYFVTLAPPLQGEGGGGGVIRVEEIYRVSPYRLNACLWNDIIPASHQPHVFHLARAAPYCSRGGLLADSKIITFQVIAFYYGAFTVA